MGGLKSLALDDIFARGTLTEADVQKFRRIFYEDGIVSVDEAEILFKLNAKCPIAHASWSAFLVEAVTDYIVFQVQPQGYVTAENAHWLVDRVSAAGRFAPGWSWISSSTSSSRRAGLP